MKEIQLCIVCWSVVSIRDYDVLHNDKEEVDDNWACEDVDWPGHVDVDLLEGRKSPMSESRVSYKDVVAQS